MTQRNATLKLLLAGTVDVGESDHPNQMRLRGILVRLDEPSTKPPNGSEGHKILVPSDVARKRLKTLINMGVNYSPDLSGHAQKRKVGVITKAWIDGKNLCVEANIWKHDFPEAQKDLKQSNLGMSMEIGDVQVEDTQAQIWKLTDFYFLGATILYRDAAAYNRTAAIAASKQGDSNMTKTAKKKAPVAGGELDAARIARISAKAAAQAVSQILSGAINRQTETLAKQSDILAGIATHLEFSREDDEDAEALDTNITTKLKAAKEEDDEDDDEDDEEASAVAATKGNKADEDDEDDDDEDEDGDMESMATGTDKGDLEDMGTEPNDEDDDDPGHMSKMAKNKGNKTSSEDKVGPNVSKGVTGSSVERVLRRKLKQFQGQLASVQAENQRLNKKLKSMSKQVAAAGEKVERRSISSSILGLLQKEGIDSRQLMASGMKLSVSEVDAMLSKHQLDVTTRMALKNELLQAGIMETGVVERLRAIR